jgi:hypothetical protein
MQNPDFSDLIEGELKRTPGDAVINVGVRALREKWHGICFHTYRKK